MNLEFRDFAKKVIFSNGFSRIPKPSQEVIDNPYSLARQNYDDMLIRRSVVHMWGMVKWGGAAFATLPFTDGHASLLSGILFVPLLAHGARGIQTLSRGLSLKETDIFRG